MTELAYNFDMGSVRDLIVKTLVCIVAAVSVVGCASTIVTAQDDVGRKALSSKNYPWYDADIQEVRRVDLGKRPDPRSLDRAKVAVRKVKTKTPPAVAPGPAGQVAAPILGALAWTMIGLVVAALIGILIWAFLRLEANEMDLKDSRPKRSMEESIKQLPFDFEADDGEAGDFRQRAAWNYNKGNYNKATILLFSHILVSLDQAGQIRLRKGKTNRQYLEEMQAPNLLGYFSDAMILFESTFFGDYKVTKEEFEAVWNELDNFQSAIHATAPLETLGVASV
ncbi:MAG: hypothetical protein AB8B55_22990 [Mariniblastus sp.]